MPLPTPPPDPSKLVQFLVERFDYVKHFAKDNPWWKMSALVVIKAPGYIVAVGIAYWFYRH